MKKTLSLLLTLVLSLALFAACATGPAEVEPEPEIPYTPNVFTGAEKREGYPDGQRPIAIMMNNIDAAMPQSGVSNADVTYEIVTEGGITRLMCVYSDYERLQGVNIGPVRSARDQHVQLMIPYQPIYMHIGGSIFATQMLANYGYETREIDGNYATIQDNFFYFDNARFSSGYAWEHCRYTTGELIVDAIDYLELLGEGEPDEPIFNFANYNDAPRQLTGGLATYFKWDFSSMNRNVSMQYDMVMNQYMKTEFGGPQIDANTGLQLGYNNVIMLFTNMELYDGTNLTHVDYDFGGFGYYFCGGRYEQVRWIKGTPTQPLRIVDAQGNEIDVQINCGNSYIAIVDYSYYDAFVESFINEGPIPEEVFEDSSASE